MNALKMFFSLLHPLGIVKQFTLWGGSSGGGAPAAQTQTQVKDLPSWALPYAQNTLSQASALTSNTQMPQYTGTVQNPVTGQNYAPGQMIAGFSGLQQQAQAGAGNLNTGPGFQQGSMMNMQAGRQAGQAGQMGEMAGMSYGQNATNPNAVSAYMNPYIQNSLNPQLQLLGQQTGIAGANQQAAATSAGAFGGSRSALANALTQQTGQLAANTMIGNAYNTAYNTAQQNMQQAANLGIQGANAGIAGAQAQAGAGTNLSNIANQGLTAQEGILSAQNTYGQQQQALGQQAINANYQNYLNQMNYPYQQLSYMSNLFNGTPMGMNAQSQVFQGNPTAAQSLSALGMGAYGLSQLAAKGGLMKTKKMKKGGKVKHFDEGGLNIIQKFNNPSTMLGDMSALSDQELQKIMAAPTTPAEAQAAAQELATRQHTEQAMQASESRGLANAYNQLPQDTQNQMASYAGGGILAFAKGGDNSLDKYMDEISGPAATYTAPTTEERQAGIAKQQEFVGGLYGKSNLDPYITQIQQQRADIASGKDMQELKGLAALQAASGMLQGTSFARGIGNAAGIFAQGTLQAKKEMRDADRALQQSEISLASAQQARADGQTGKAIDLENQGEAAKQKSAELAQGAAEKKASIQASVDNSVRQAQATMAATMKPTDMGHLAEVKYAKQVAEDPTIANDPVKQAQARDKAWSDAARDSKPGFASAENAANKVSDARLDNALAMNGAYMKAMQKGDWQTAGMIRAQVAQTLNTQQPQPGAQPQPGGQPQPQPMYAVNPTTNQRIVSTDGGRTWNPVGGQ